MKAKKPSTFVEDWTKAIREMPMRKRVSKPRPRPVVLGKVLAKHIRGIYATWHACALPKREIGLPKGTLCDACNEMVAAHVQDILAELGLPDPPPTPRVKRGKR